MLRRYNILQHRYKKTKLIKHGQKIYIIFVLNDISTSSYGANLELENDDVRTRNITTECGTHHKLGTAAGDAKCH